MTFGRGIARAVALYVAGASLGVAGDVAPVEVSEQGFCLEKTALDCDRFARDGGRVAMAELPRNNENKPVIYFHSVQRMAPKSTVVHVWSGHDDQLRAKLYIGDAFLKFGREAVAELRDWFGGIQLPGGFVVPMGHSGDSEAPAYRAWSERVVHRSRLVLEARVEQIGGGPVPGSKPQSITIVETEGETRADRDVAILSTPPP